MRKPYHQCIDCRKNVWVKGGRCKKCYWKNIKENPEQHPTFKHGHKRNNKCLDCGKRICFGNLRCQKCYHKFVIYKGLRAGRNNGMYKNGLPKCKKCGKGLKNYNAKYCKKCLWTISFYRNKIIKAQRKRLHIRPNKPELILKILLSKIVPKEYKYVGNGKFIINGFNPDFISKKSQKIIEVYGDYWHRRNEVVERDKRRLKSYKKQGYETLIIWENELKNLEYVAAKILMFNEL